MRGEAQLPKVRKSRSPLYRWLDKNRAEIAEVFATHPHPPWKALADLCRTRQVKNAKGNPPTRKAVRDAWAAVTAERKPPKRRNRFTVAELKTLAVFPPRRGAQP